MLTGLKSSSGLKKLRSAPPTPTWSRNVFTVSLIYSTVFTLSCFFAVPSYQLPSFEASKLTRRLTSTTYNGVALRGMTLGPNINLWRSKCRCIVVFWHKSDYVLVACFSFCNGLLNWGCVGPYSKKGNIPFPSVAKHTCNFRGNKYLKSRFEVREFFELYFSAV